MHLSIHSLGAFMLASVCPSFSPMLFASVSFLAPPDSLHLYSLLFLPYTQRLALEEVHRGLRWAYLLPLFSRRRARCRLSLYTHFRPHGQDGVFSVALGLHFQRFPSSCLSDENSNPFFPTRSASSGIMTGPLHLPSHTPPTLKHQIFHFAKQRRGER